MPFTQKKNIRNYTCVWNQLPIHWLPYIFDVTWILEQLNNVYIHPWCFGNIYTYLYTQHFKRGVYLIWNGCIYAVVGDWCNVLGQEIASRNYM